MYMVSVPFMILLINIYNIFLNYKPIHKIFKDYNQFQDSKQIQNWIDMLYYLMFKEYQSQ